MKNNNFPPTSPICSRKKVSMLGLLSLLPATSLAKNNFSKVLPVEMSMPAFLLIGFLLLLGIIMFFIFKHRFSVSNRELLDITTELNTIRKRLTESGKELEQSQQELTVTTNHYQDILFDAKVGMFQMDSDEKCTYLNTALQKMSGLYPKKALEKGLHSAIHPEDLEPFKKAWKAFTQGGDAFEMSFRFCPDRQDEVYVACCANKVLNEKKEVESYVGWITDVSDFQENLLQQEASTAHYEYFIKETIESHYQLILDPPISLSDNASEIADTIIKGLVIDTCNDTFASLYGATPAELKKKSICDLPGGCGPFKNGEFIKEFLGNGCKITGIESVQQDPSGNRVTLLNNVIGLVEDNTLISIWGSHQNISQQKREKAELTSQAQFMQRILGALPADIHVKDTRCRYLFASKKTAERTGIPEKEWIGKTIFEIMPGTPSEHDKIAIKTMKSGKLHRTACHYKAHEKSGWMETLQIPLVSDEGLVEGVISLSLDISEQKKKETEALHYRTELEKQIKQVQSELATSQAEYEKAATALAEIIQKLNLAEVEQTNREHEFKQHLSEHKHSEETLRQSKQELFTRQQQLGEQLSNRLTELDNETNKRMKWEDLLKIREKDLRATEQNSIDLNSQINEMSRQHASDLEHERAEHKVSEENLIRSTEELDELKQQFYQRIEEETKSIKQELAKKQIREKGLKKHEKEMEKCIRELENSLQLKTKEYTDQINAREHAELLQKQIGQKLESMNQHQQDLIDSETRKLTLNIAEDRLEEIKLHQQASDLKREKKVLEDNLRNREIELAESHTKLKQLTHKFKNIVNADGEVQNKLVEN